MNFLNLLFAVIATYRLVELFLLDRITLKLRTKFPSYLWSCPRCLSVWSGIFTTLSYIFCPYLNYPLAFSWIYFVLKDRLTTKQGKHLKVSVAPSGQWSISHNDLAPQEVLTIFHQMTSSLSRTV